MKNLVFILSLFFCSTLAADTIQPLDSVGLKEINGKYFVQHKVEKGEGLYGIARRYQSTVDEIKKANPEMGESLKIGQVVLVPIVYKPQQGQAPTPTPAPKPAPAPTEETIIHVVRPGETLYSISNLYKVGVEDIKKKNNLTSNNLSAGQELVIKGTKKEHTENYGGEEKPKPDPKPEPKPTPPAGQENKKGYEYNSTTGEVKETGFALIALNENINQERSFCLHPTAPVGTIIMISNPSTNKSVFVRVVGKPSQKEEGVIIKLSKAAGERLGIGENDRTEVRLNYARY